MITSGNESSLPAEVFHKSSKTYGFHIFTWLLLKGNNTQLHYRCFSSKQLLSSAFITHSRRHAPRLYHTCGICDAQAFLCQSQDSIPSFKQIKLVILERICNLNNQTRSPFTFIMSWKDPLDILPSGCFVRKF